MRLGDFLERAGDSSAAPSRPVDFKIVWQDQLGTKKKIDVKAVLVYVDEHERQAALRSALVELRKQYPDGIIPPARESDEQIYQTLFLALRDEEDPRKHFAQSVTELRKALVKPVAEELYANFNQFMEEEFPPVVSAEDFKKMVEDAKGKSLAELLSSTNSLQIRLAMPGLINLFAK